MQKHENVTATHDKKQSRCLIWKRPRSAGPQGLDFGFEEAAGPPGVGERQRGGTHRAAGHRHYRLRDGSPPRPDSPPRPARSHPSGGAFRVRVS